MDSVEAGPESRWPARRALAMSLQVLAYGTPLAAAVAVSVLVSHQLGRPRGWGGEVADWAAVIAASSATLYAVQRLARRFLPLAALLKLSLVFPDQAPRRLAVARRAGSVRRLARTTQSVEFQTPSAAAAAILELVGALHAHDRRTRGHSERVRALTDLLAAELRLEPGDLDRLRWASLLHDIGKLKVPARILNKPGKPTPTEWAALRRHPEEGARLAAPLAEWLGPWANAIAEHHERFDGNGYPKGLKGTAISYAGRIVAVADAFEVMTAPRPYKRAFSAAAAREELTRLAGAQFDPAIVRALLRVSVGRLRLAIGPLAWLAQAPLVGWMPHAAGGLAAAGTQAAGVLGAAAGASLAATGGTLGVTAPAAAAPASPPPAVQPAQPGLTGVSSGRTAATVLGRRFTPTATAPPTTATTLRGNGNGVAGAKAASSGSTRPQGAGTGSAPTSTTSPRAGNGTSSRAPKTSNGAGTTPSSTRVTQPRHVD